MKRWRSASEIRIARPKRWTMRFALGDLPANLAGGQVRPLGDMRHFVHPVVGQWHRDLAAAHGSLQPAATLPLDTGTVHSELLVSRALNCASDRTRRNNGCDTAVCGSTGQPAPVVLTWNDETVVGGGGRITGGPRTVEPPMV
jgi:hypothetical protein